MVPGKRTSEKTNELLEDFAKRTDGVLPGFFTSDEYKPYAKAILKQYGTTVQPPRTGRPGRPRGPYLVPPQDLIYATVHKTRKKGRVVNVHTTVVYGTDEQLEDALAASTVSKTINTSFVERYNGTDRNFNSRKRRKTYAFSKEIDHHDAASWLAVTHYNFCRPNDGLTIAHENRTKERRTPAMAAGLVERCLSIEEIVGAQLYAAHGEPDS